MQNKVKKNQECCNSSTQEVRGQPGYTVSSRERVPETDIKAYKHTSVQSEQRLKVPWVVHSAFIWLPEFIILSVI